MHTIHNDTHVADVSQRIHNIQIYRFSFCHFRFVSLSVSYTDSDSQRALWADCECACSASEFYCCIDSFSTIGTCSNYVRLWAREIFRLREWDSYIFIVFPFSVPLHTSLTNARVRWARFQSILKYWRAAICFQFREYSSRSRSYSHVIRVACCCDKDTFSPDVTFWSQYLGNTQDETGYATTIATFKLSECVWNQKYSFQSDVKSCPCWRFGFFTRRPCYAHTPDNSSILVRDFPSLVTQPADSSAEVASYRIGSNAS